MKRKITYFLLNIDFSFLVLHQIYIYQNKRNTSFIRTSHTRAVTTLTRISQIITQSKLCRFLFAESSFTVFNKSDNTSILRFSIVVRLGISRYFAAWLYSDSYTSDCQKYTGVSSNPP